MKTVPYDLEELKAQLKFVKRVLRIYTLLHPLVFVLLIFINDLSLFDGVIIATHFLFLLFFLSFLWMRLPMDSSDKIFETIMILIFGLFALWMWLPKEKELKIMVEKFNSKKPKYQPKSIKNVYIKK